MLPVLAVTEAVGVTFVVTTMVMVLLVAVAGVAHPRLLTIWQVIVFPLARDTLV